MKLLVSIAAVVICAGDPMAQTNQAPTITAINPASATAGGMSFQLSVIGTGFVFGKEVPGSVVEWSMGDVQRLLTTQFIDSSHLVAAVTADLIANPGTASIRVVSFGEVLSNAVPFTIVAAPAITSLNPPFLITSCSGSVFSVLGSGFVPGSTVQWSARETGHSLLPVTFISAGQIAVEVPAALLASPGQAALSIMNPEGAASNLTVIQIVPAALALNRIQPRSTAAGGPDFTLTATGTGFLQGGSRLVWTGATGSPTALATTFVNPCTLTASVPAALTANPGKAGVAVYSLATGSQSNALSFVITPARLTIVTTTLPKGGVGVAYSQILSASGGTPPYSWSIGSGSLPAGLVLNSSTGAIAGTPAAPGTFNFTVRVTDAAQAAATQALSITVDPAAFAITTHPAARRDESPLAPRCGRVTPALHLRRSPRGTLPGSTCRGVA